MRNEINADNLADPTEQEIQDYIAMHPQLDRANNEFQWTMAAILLFSCSFINAPEYRRNIILCIGIVYLFNRRPNLLNNCLEAISSFSKCVLRCLPCAKSYEPIALSPE